MNSAQDKKLEVVLTQLNSYLQDLAIRKRQLQPNAEIAIGGVNTGTIPTGVKGFNIINLGLDGLATDFSPIGVSGITGITVIPQVLRIFGYSIENDQNQIIGPIVVTPDTNHHVLIQYLS